MRIAYVHKRWSLQGGTERHLVGIATWMAANGHEVHVFANRREAELPKGIVFHKIPILRLGSTARILSLAYFADRRVRPADFDVVQGFGKTIRHDVFRAGGGVHQAYLERVFGARARLMAWLPKHWAQLSIERRTFGHGNFRRIIANSDMAKAEILRFYPRVPAEKMVVIRNGVDLERFHPRRRDEVRRRIRGSLGVPPEAPLALFVGTGFARKGLDTLLAALQALGSAAPALAVAGKDEGAGGPGAGTMSGRARFLGSRSDVEDLYAAADLFVFPTRYDPSANVCLEALASGLPVVTTTANGAAEILEEGVTGSVVPPDDPQALAASIRFFLENRRFDAARPACRAAAERHSIDANARATLELYEDVVREKKGGG
ncbi:MAG: glycosyltransferase family 4 protein [Planctomycetota bacterium]|mgnify:CR=1 FL=1